MIGRVYRMFDGVANTMWYLSQNTGKRNCMGNFGMAHDVGSCAHVLKDTAELQRCLFGRVFKGKGSIRLNPRILKKCTLKFRLTFS